MVIDKRRSSTLCRSRKDAENLLTPNRVLSRHQNKILTYDQLDRDSNTFARGLANVGVKRGDRCAVMLGNNIEYATATYAIFKLGAILVRFWRFVKSFDLLVDELNRCH